MIIHSTRTITLESIPVDPRSSKDGPIVHIVHHVLSAPSPAAGAAASGGGSASPYAAAGALAAHGGAGASPSAAGAADAASCGGASPSTVATKTLKGCLKSGVSRGVSVSFNPTVTGRYLTECSDRDHTDDCTLDLNETERQSRGQANCYKRPLGKSTIWPTELDKSARLFQTKILGPAVTLSDLILWARKPESPSPLPHSLDCSRQQLFYATENTVYSYLIELAKCGYIKNDLAYIKHSAKVLSESLVQCLDDIDLLPEDIKKSLPIDVFITRLRRHLISTNTKKEVLTKDEFRDLITCSNPLKESLRVTLSVYLESCVETCKTTEKTTDYAAATDTFLTLITQLKEQKKYCEEPGYFSNPVYKYQMRSLPRDIANAIEFDATLAAFLDGTWIDGETRVLTCDYFTHDELRDICDAAYYLCKTPLLMTFLKGYKGVI